MGEFGRRAMFEIMGALPGGTLITNDRVVRNVNTVFEEGDIIKPEVTRRAKPKQINKIDMEQQKTEETKQKKDLKRSYFAKIAIVGPTGTGKSYISKTANRNTMGYVNIERKPLSFRGGEPFKFMGNPKSWDGFIKNIKDFAENPEIESIFIDSQTEAFAILNKQMGDTFSGWDIPKFYNKKVYEYFQLLKGIEKDVIVLSHDEMVKLPGESTPLKRMVVHNKEYEGKVEREFTIVLFSYNRLKKDKPEYYLCTFAEGTSAKCPEGLFGEGMTEESPIEIPNSAKFILESVSNYYSI